MTKKAVSASVTSTCRLQLLPLPLSLFSSTSSLSSIPISHSLFTLSRCFFLSLPSSPSTRLLQSPSRPPSADGRLTGDDKPLCDIWPGKGLLPTVRTLKISLLLLRPPPLVRLSLPPLIHLLRGTPRLPLSFVLPWSLSLHPPLSGRRLLSLRFPASSFGGWPDLGLLSFLLLYPGIGSSFTDICTLLV